MDHLSKYCGRVKTIYGIYHADILGYIGQTVDLERRQTRHRYPVSREPRAVDKWIASVGSVEFKVLEKCDWCVAIQREAWWKRKLSPLIRA